MILLILSFILLVGSIILNKKSISLNKKTKMDLEDLEKLINECEKLKALIVEERDLNGIRDKKLY